MSLQQTFYGVAQPIVNQTNAGVSSLSGSISGNSSSGAGPNLEVSTLTVNDSGNITLDWNNGGGTLNFGFEATNTSSFILQQGIGVSGTKVAGPDGCLQVLEKDGGTNQVFAPLQASGFEVCATAYPGGAFAGLYFSTIGSVLYSAVGQPLTIDAPAGVSVSSLSVSSINGQTPGGAGAGPNPSVSTLSFSGFTQGSAGFMNMNSFFAIFDSASGTPAGNNYTLGIQAQTNPNTAGNPFSFMSSFVSTVALTNFTPGYDVSPATASLITGASSDGRAIIANATPLSTLTLLANPVNIPYDLQVSSINGAEFTTTPKMNWGAVNIPASGSTIASIADNPYSGDYYQQVTYRGNVLGSISTLFASTINGNSFYIYGEPGQQVQYFTIGN